MYAVQKLYRQVTDLDLQYSSTVQDKIVLCQQLTVLLLFDFLLSSVLELLLNFTLSKTQVLGKKIGASIPNKAQRAKIQRIKIPNTKILGHYVLEKHIRLAGGGSVIGRNVTGSTLRY